MSILRHTSKSTGLARGSKPWSDYTENEFDYTINLLREEWPKCCPKDQRELDRMIALLVVMRNRKFTKRLKAGAPHAQ